MMTDPRITHEFAQGPHGPVPVRIYHPAQAAAVGIVWIHGGAFTMGDLDMPEADWVGRCLADAGVMVVSVDYRLALDGVHFPVPSDDVLAAWAWATADQLDIPAASWHLGGASAGANLAASISAQARDGRAALPRTMILVYPVMHANLPEPSADLAAALADLPEEMRFLPKLNQELNMNYVGDESLLTHPYAFPAHGNLAGLPPALVLNADVDDLRPSGEAYAAALVTAGVDVTVIREVGSNHGHLNDPASPAAQRTVRRITDWLLRSQLVGEAHPGAHLPTDSR